MLFLTSHYFSHIIIKFISGIAMQILIRKISGWLYKNNFLVSQWRLQRMTSFLSLVNPPKYARIIDLGGSDYFWNLIEHNFEVTIVNLPGSFTTPSNSDRYTYIEGDATDLNKLFTDKSFDIVFSNSVIEHVGNEDKQAAFAKEVCRRLANSYWIQTPSTKFPLEIHTGVLFYWNIPESWRKSLMNSWEKKLPAWSEMIKELNVLSKNRMMELFPNSVIYIERKFLLEKSYTFYRPFKTN